MKKETKKQGRTYFTRTEVVSFGNYLLSEFRESNIIHPSNARSVTDSDLANWRGYNPVVKEE